MSTLCTRIGAMVAAIPFVLPSSRRITPASGQPGRRPTLADPRSDRRIPSRPAERRQSSASGSVPQGRGGSLIRLGSLIAAVWLLGACSAPAAVDGAPALQHGIGDLRPWTHERFDAASDKFTFAVFADLTGGERDRVFETAVAQLELLRPEFIINVGDLIEGEADDEAGLAEEWDAFDRRADAARAPIFYVGGNHDLTGETQRRVWEARYGPRYYHFLYRDVLFLVLDTEDNSPERMQEIHALRREAVEVYKSQGPEAFAQTAYSTMPERTAGTIGAEQSTYFQRVIAEHPDVRWTFLFLHKPAWTRADEAQFAAIENALADRPYTVFTGHVQAFGYEQRRGRDYIRLATTGGEQFPDEGRSADHVTLVTVGDADVSVAHLLLEGILDKTARVPLDADGLCFESTRCEH